MYAKELINLSSKLDKIGYYGIASNIDQLRLGQAFLKTVRTVGPAAEELATGIKNLVNPAAKAAEEAAATAKAAEEAAATAKSVKDANTAYQVGDLAGLNGQTAEAVAKDVGTVGSVAKITAKDIEKLPTILKDPEKWRGLKLLGRTLLATFIIGGIAAEFRGDKKVDPATDSTATDAKAPTVDADGTIADLPVSKETWQKLFIDKETNNGQQAHYVLEDLKADRSNTSDKKVHRVSDAGIMSVASWIIESFENKFAPGHEDLMKKELIYIQTKMGKISGEILQSDVEKAVQIAQIQGNTPQFIQYIRDNLKVTNPNDPKNIK